MPEPPRSFSVHGGRCRVDAAEGVVRFEQSRWRHLHAFHWLVSAALVALAAYGALTGWAYTAPGKRVTWPWLLAVGLAAPARAALRMLRRRLRGFAFARSVPLQAVEGARLTTTRVRWYFKTNRTVPVLVVRYRVDGRRRKRRAMFDPRYDDRDVRRAREAFEAAGVVVEVDPGVREAVDLDGASAPVGSAD